MNTTIRDILMAFAKFLFSLCLASFFVMVIIAVIALASWFCAWTYLATGDPVVGPAVIAVFIVAVLIYLEL